MKPGARFCIDGVLTSAPKKNEKTGKLEIVVQVIVPQSKTTHYFRIVVQDAEDVQGMDLMQRVRVEGRLGSSLGNSHIFYSLYADAVLPYYGEPQPREVKQGEMDDLFAPPPSGSDPQELGYGARRSSSRGGYGANLDWTYF